MGKFKNVKKLIYEINNQYRYLLKGRSRYLNFYQWFILFISQIFVVYALMRYIVKKIFKICRRKLYFVWKDIVDNIFNYIFVFCNRMRIIMCFKNIQILI